MNHRLSRRVRFAALALALGLASVGSAEDRASCAAVARKIQSDVSARPERVLILVEDALVVDESCACEVTKAAILASKAKPNLVGQIVFTAVAISPANAVLIAECATAASPAASGEIKAALAKALGGVPGAATAPAPAPPEAASGSTSASPPEPTAPTGGKNPAADKSPPPAPPPPNPTVDFGLSPVTIGGVYLVYPGAGGSRVVRDSDGRLVLLGPNGTMIPLDRQSIQITRRPVRTPPVIIIHPPSATSSQEPPEP